MVQTNPITHVGAGLPCSATRQLSLLNNALLPKGMALPTLSFSVLSAQPISWHFILGLLSKAIIGGSAEGLSGVNKVNLYCCS